jgi:hypothetical protein
MGKIGRRSVTDERSPDICNLLVGHHARCIFANPTRDRLQLALMVLQKQRKRVRIARIQVRLCRSRQ